MCEQYCIWYKDEIGQELPACQFKGNKSKIQKLIRKIKLKDYRKEQAKIKERQKEKALKEEKEKADKEKVLADLLDKE